MTTPPSQPQEPRSRLRSAESGIHGTDDLVVKIHDLRDGHEIARRLLGDANLLSRVVQLEVKDEEDDDDEVTPAVTEIKTTGADDTQDSSQEENEISVLSTENANNNGSASPSTPPVDTIVKLSQPVIQILNAISRSNSHLKEFTWQCNGWGNKQVRPTEFWDALWKHAGTLRKLDLGFYTHEVAEVDPAQVPTEFPLLTHLTLETSGSHGCDGAAIDKFLQSCPHLTSLSFDYPGCDLDTCQIQNLSWTYDFASLKTLKVDGYDSHPSLFNEFLVRNSSIENLNYDVDGEIGDDVRLPTEALPNLKSLVLPRWGHNRPIKDWLNKEVNRPIRFLTASGYTRSKWPDIVVAGERLQCLEFRTGSNDWRPKTPGPDTDSDSDSSDDENESGETKQKETAEERKERKAKEKKAMEDEYMDDIRTRKELLSKLTGLKELCIGFETGNSVYSSESGGYITAPAMNVDDLHIALSILPSETRIRALRLWDKDPDTGGRGEKLPNEILEDFPSVPDRLEFLSWEAEEKILYRLVREGGAEKRIRAVVCELPRRENTGGNEEEKVEWESGRILEYE